MPRPGGCHTPGDDGRARGRRAVLAALTRAEEPQTVSSLADRLGMHANTVRGHLAALVAAGQVGRSASVTSKPGRPTLRYVAIPGMDPGGIRHYRELAGVLAGELADGSGTSERMVQLGRRWGRQIAGPELRRQPSRRAAIQRAVEVLDELGFDPALVDPDQLDAGTAPKRTAIGLRHCPFLEIAQLQPQVICALHLGMVQGILADTGAGVTATGIEPFARPNLCVISVGHREQEDP